MSMHLAPVWVTDTKYNRKSKSKPKTQSLIKAEKEHAKFLKKMGISTPKECKTKRSIPVNHSPGETCKHKLSNNIGGVAPVRKENTYSGARKLLGIATMHKSNAVPVFDKQSAEDIAKMRR